MMELNRSIEVIENEICEEENLIRDIDSAILDLAPLNEKINQSSKIIETYTSEQKIATHESSRTAADIAGKATELVSMSTAMSEASMRLEKITGELEKLTEKIQSH